MCYFLNSFFWLSWNILMKAQITADCQSDVYPPYLPFGQDPNLVQSSTWPARKHFLDSLAARCILADKPERLMKCSENGWLLWNGGSPVLPVPVSFLYSEMQTAGWTWTFATWTCELFLRMRATGQDQPKTDEAQDTKSFLKPLQQLETAAPWAYRIKINLYLVKPW